MDLRYRAKEVQVSDYFRVLFRRRIVALLTFLSVFAAVLIHTFLMTPIYEAFAVVQIREDKTGNAVPLTIGAFQPPGAFESGPKDTFVAPKDFITVWVGRYTIGGTSVWHCHILSHEDSSIVEMMRPLVVGDKAQTQLPVILTQARLDRLIRNG